MSTMTIQDKQAMARQFLSVLGRPDAEVVKSVAVNDVVWSFPGKRGFRERRTVSTESWSGRSTNRW
jgi:hypothetical protein